MDISKFQLFDSNISEFSFQFVAYATFYDLQSSVVQLLLDLGAVVLVVIKPCSGGTSIAVGNCGAADSPCNDLVRTEIPMGVSQS